MYVCDHSVINLQFVTTATDVCLLATSALPSDVSSEPVHSYSAGPIYPVGGRDATFARWQRGVITVVHLPVRLCDVRVSSSACVTFCSPGTDGRCLINAPQFMHAPSFLTHLKVRDGNRTEPELITMGLVQSSVSTIFRQTMQICEIILAHS